MSTYLLGLPLLAVAAVLQATVFARLHLVGGTIDLVPPAPRRRHH